MSVDGAHIKVDEQRCYPCRAVDKNRNFVYSVYVMLEIGVDTVAFLGSARKKTGNGTR